MTILYVTDLINMQELNETANDSIYTYVFLFIIREKLIEEIEYSRVV